MRFANLRGHFPAAALGLLILLEACTNAPRGTFRNTSPDEASITPEALLRHVAILASDDYEGRAPGTRGEQLATDYIAREFHSAGLVPGGSRSFFQDVQLRRSRASGTLVATSGSRNVLFRPGLDFLVQPERGNSDLRDETPVFAGYGIVAPEFSRDDYAGVDVRGRAVIVLAGEPEGFPLASSSRLEPAAMAAITEHRRTLHRWVWMKQLRAVERGARAVFIIVPDASLGARRTYFEHDYLLPESLPAWAPPLSVLLSESAFLQMTNLAGAEASELRRSAASAEFRARPLEFRVTAETRADTSSLTSRNVVGLIQGAERGCVVLTAHWDGYGRDPQTAGDGIWNGAVDDAGGVAQLIEIGRMLASAPPPRRSIFFVATTGEERGFLGARHFAAHSPCPPGDMVGVINLDWFYELGPTRRFAHHALGYSSLDRIVERLAQSQGRSVTAVNAYISGGDQLPFMLAGVPGLHGGSVPPLIDRPAAFEEAYYGALESAAVRREGNSNEDEIRPEWDLRGAAQDAELLRQLVTILAAEDATPCWTVPSSFALHGRACH